jgi:hypothetical protein
VIGQGFPKRCGDRLFVVRDDLSIRWLDNPTKLFAWIDSMAQVAWATGQDLITQERFYESLRDSGTKGIAHFEAVETLAHFPPLPGMYYACPTLPAGGNGALASLVGMFCAHSVEDSGLIMAMIMTPFWGGEPGSRPMFLITSPEDDPKRGRGIGKSKLCELIGAELAGGSVEVTPGDEMAKIKTRLLSPDAASKRTVRLDNVKNDRLAWSDLEGLVTAGTISGHVMYRSEGSRPNTITWFITANTPGTGKDLAQRVIPIVLARPIFRPDWEQEVRQFIRTNRFEILADIRDALAGPGVPITPTRWGCWESQVLSKIGEVGLVTRCQKLIRLRQAEMDADDEEQAIVTHHFEAELRSLGLDPDHAWVRITAGVAAEWLNAALNERFATNKASARLKNMGIARLSKGRAAAGRYWDWKGRSSGLQNPACEVEKAPPGQFGPRYKTRALGAPEGSPTSAPASSSTPCVVQQALGLDDPLACFDPNP